jgi:GntR family transcriptional regulator, transcriptional repressor for pyruvate dehydrogenase complex
MVERTISLESDNRLLRRTHPAFSAISVTRSWEQVVNQIEGAIRSSELARGERLPTERELSAIFDVSRGVVREALKVLSTMGLVEARQGSGIYVSNEPSRSISRAFVLSVAPNAESVDRLIDFRLILERNAAWRAAEQRTDADLEQMRSALVIYDLTPPPVDWKTFSESDDAFHGAIAVASGNPYLSLAVSAAREMLQDVIEIIARQPGDAEVAVRHHKRILDAIQARDHDQAGNAMEEHIRYTADSFQARVRRSPERVEEDRSP